MKKRMVSRRGKEKRGGRECWGRSNKQQIFTQDNRVFPAQRGRRQRRGANGRVRTTKTKVAQRLSHVNADDVALFVLPQQEVHIDVANKVNLPSDKLPVKSVPLALA